MGDTLTNNLVLVVLTLVSLWWTIGGHDRFVLGAIRERLELLQLLDENSELAGRLRREVAARSTDYLDNVVGRRVQMLLYFLLVTAGFVVGAVVAPKHGSTWQQGGVVGGSVVAFAFLAFFYAEAYRVFRSELTERRRSKR